MNKLISFLMVFSLIFSVGCSDKQEQISPSVASSELKRIEDMRIGLLMDSVYGKNDFLTQAYHKIIELQAKYGFYATVTEAEDDLQRTIKAEELINSGCDLIIALGGQYTEIFKPFAEKHIDIAFSIIDAYNIEDDAANIKSFVYDAKSGCYVFGVMLANAFLDEKTFGYIGNFENESNYEYEFGYTMGIQDVLPEAEIVTNFVDSYSDIEAVSKAAYEMQKNGIKVIIGSVSASANEGLYEAALDLGEKNTPIYVTGLSVDQTTEDNEYIIGGTTKDTAAAVELIIESYAKGEFNLDDVSFGIVEGGFGVVHVTGKEAIFRNEDIITDEIVEIGKDVLYAIESGFVEFE